MPRIVCRGLLIDMDGVLVDSTPAVARVWARWAARHNMDPVYVTARAHGRTSRASIQELLPDESPDIQHGKPHPEPYLKGASLLQFPPADCVVIEDASSGTRSGKSAGCRVLAIRTTSSDADLLSAGADCIANH